MSQHFESAKALDVMLQPTVFTSVLDIGVKEQMASDVPGAQAGGLIF
jgi:hypothetical protein